MTIEDEDTLRELLGQFRVAVVVASATLEKAAHIVPAYPQRHENDDFCRKAKCHLPMGSLFDRSLIGCNGSNT